MPRGGVPDRGMPPGTCGSDRFKNGDGFHSESKQSSDVVLLQNIHTMVLIHNPHLMGIIRPFSCRVFVQSWTTV